MVKYVQNYFSATELLQLQNCYRTSKVKFHSSKLYFSFYISQIDHLKWDLWFIFSKFYHLKHSFFDIRKFLNFWSISNLRFWLKIVDKNKSLIVLVNMFREPYFLSIKFNIKTYKFKVTVWQLVAVFAFCMMFCS